METALQILVHSLAVSRMDLGHQLAEKERLLEDIARSYYGVELTALEKEIKATKDMIELEEQAVSVEAGRVYDGKDKNVHPAVKIKTFQKVDYNPGAMIAYAVEHDMPALLQLNKRNVTAFIKSGTGPWFVGIYPEDRVTIAKDLGDYV